MSAPDSFFSSAGFRDFGLGAQVLRKLGVRRVELLTNRPRKIIGLEGFGIEVCGTVALGARGGHTDGQ